MDLTSSQFQEAVLQRLDAVEQTVDRMQQVLHDTHIISISAYNTAARVHNSRPTEEVRTLLPLRREQPGGALGQLPPAGVFPAMHTDFWQLTVERLDQLAAFYGQAFREADATLEQRRPAFYQFIFGMNSASGPSSMRRRQQQQ